MGLQEVLDGLKENPKNQIQRQEVIKVSNGDNLIVTIYPADKKAQFHEPYEQTATSIDELKPLIDFFDIEKYRVNLV